MRNINFIIVILLFISLLVSCNNSSASNSSSTTSSESSSEVEGILEVKNVRQYLGLAPVKILTYLDDKHNDNLDLYYDIIDKTICEIESGYVKGQSIGETIVYASTESGQEVGFTVTIQDPTTYKYYRDMNSILENYDLLGQPKNPTLFIGDSFFDKYFWSTFYDDFSKEQNVFLGGISGSKSNDWQMLKEKLIYNFEPKNIVIHIGTNDIYDSATNLSVNQYYEGIVEFLKDVCEKSPNNKIYYFGIENRLNNLKNIYAEQVTDLIKTDFAPNYDNFVYIDSPSVINSNMSLYLSSDGIHLSEKGYEYYVSMLNEIVEF